MSSNRSIVITIDGPAGSGKSTAARGLAARLQYRFLDTGAMYRAITLACQRRGIDLENRAEAARIASVVQLKLDGPRIYLDGEDVSRDIRTSQVTIGATIVAAHPEIRDVLVEQQRVVALDGNVVTEGRDQGTVVFPHAQCKFFLTADPNERATRRRAELEQRGETVDFEKLVAQIIDRDHRDETRAVAPLKPAADAILIDTSKMSPSEVLDHLEAISRERIQIE